MRERPLKLNFATCRTKADSKACKVLCALGYKTKLANTQEKEPYEANCLSKELQSTVVTYFRQSE